jgi:prolyl-tRNA synthetase
VKFKDADLLGIPLRIVISERGLASGTLELKWRWAAAADSLAVAGAAGKIADLIREERRTGERFRRHAQEKIERPAQRGK